MKARIAERLSLCFGFSIALIIPVVIGSGSFSVPRAGAVLIIASLSIFFGQALHQAFDLPKKPGFTTAFEIVLGFSALSLLHLAVTTTFNLGTGGALLIDTVLVSAFSVTMAYRNSLSQCAPSCNVTLDNAYPPRTIVVDIFIIVLISIVVTLWTREALAAVREAEITGVFRVWSDFLLQAAEIKYQENYPAFARQSLYLSDTAQIFYHRASYSLSAVYSWVSNDNSLATSTYFWMPTGIVLMGISAYGLGSVLFGRIAGIASVTALFLLPDASMYWLSNGYFAFHWLIQVAPGAGYAISIALIAIATFVIGIKYSHYPHILVGFFLALASTFFRTHIAIPMVFLFVFLALVAWRPPRRMYRIVGIALLLLLAALIILLFERVTFAPHFLSGSRDWLRYIEAVHAAIPIPYEGLYAEWTADASNWWKAIVGYLLMLFAEFGALLPCMLVLAWLRIRASITLWAVDIIPFALLAVHTAIIFFMPTPSNGDITEWSHRSFVLVYAVLLIFVASWITSICRGFNFRSYIAKLFWFAIVLCTVLTGATVPWVYGKNVQYGSLRDGPTACATAISRDMFKATNFIHEHSLDGEILLSSDGDPGALVVALTGRQAFVSRIAIFQKIGGSLAELATARIALNDGLRESMTYEDIAAFGRQHNVKWYLLRHEDMPTWPQELLDKAVFTSGNIYVFKLI